MENVKIIGAVVIVILLGAAGYYGYTVMEENEAQRLRVEAKAKAEKLALEQKQAEEAKMASRTKCAETANYFVVGFDHENAVGQDILVKTKKDGIAYTCKYELATDDFEVKNSDPEYFKVVTENALITDVGTGPSGRSFRLYDLIDKKIITEKKYFDELTISSSTLTYFGLAKQKADSKNCKDFKKFTDEGLTPNLVIDKTVDLKTYLVKEGKTTKCVATQ